MFIAFKCFTRRVWAWLIKTIREFTHEEFFATKNT